MPQYDEKDIQSKNNQSTRDERKGDREERRSSGNRRSIGAALGFSGDKTRSGQFNAELDKILEDNAEYKDILMYGKIRDLPLASVNYLGVKQENGVILAVALIFENNGKYIREPKSGDVYFTYDMLQDKDGDFLAMVRKSIADAQRVDEEDVSVVDAQILSPDFEVTTDSVRHLAYSLGTLMDNLAGFVPDDYTLSEFPTYTARMISQPGGSYETQHLHRADFKVEVNQLANTNRKFTPTLMGDGVDGDAGKTIVAGFVDLEYTGPEEAPDKFQGPAEKFKPNQFTVKLALSAVDTSSSEAYIYERGLMGLASIGEAHYKFTGMEILTQNILSDKSIDLGSLVKQMWLPVAIDAGKLKSADDIRDALEMMVYPEETYVTVLHRAGDTSNGIIHMLARIGEGDDKFLDALLQSLDTIKPGLADDLAKYLNVSDIRCDDIVIGSSPRVFGTFNEGGRPRSLEHIDLLHVAKFGEVARENYGEWVAATSIEHRELKIDDSQDFQITFLEEAVSGTEITANGAEYQLNPEFLMFLYDKLGRLFDDVDMSGFTDCRPERNRFHRVRDEDRRVLRGGSSSSRFSDSRQRSFGGLSTRK